MKDNSHAHSQLAKALPKPFKIKVVIPEKTLFFGHVNSVTAISDIGEFMVLNGHESYIFHLSPSIITCKIDTVETKIVLDSENIIFAISKQILSNGVYEDSYMIFCEKAYLLDEIAKEYELISQISNTMLQQHVKKSIDLLYKTSKI